MITTTWRILWIAPRRRRAGGRRPGDEQDGGDDGEQGGASHGRATVVELARTRPRRVNARTTYAARAGTGMRVSNARSAHRGQRPVCAGQPTCQRATSVAPFQLTNSAAPEPPLRTTATGRVRGACACQGKRNAR